MSSTNSEPGRIGSGRGAFRVNYLHYGGTFGNPYRVARPFDEIESALTFMHVNALVHPLPGVHLLALGSTDPDSEWCQEHGHDGFMPGSTCAICDEYAALGAESAAVVCRRTIAAYAVSEHADTCRECGAFVWQHRDPRGERAAVVADLAAAERDAGIRS